MEGTRGASRGSKQPGSKDDGGMRDMVWAQAAASRSPVRTRVPGRSVWKTWLIDGLVKDGGRVEVQSTAECRISASERSARTPRGATCSRSRTPGTQPEKQATSQMTRKNKGAKETSMPLESQQESMNSHLNVRLPTSSPTLLSGTVGKNVTHQAKQRKEPNLRDSPSLSCRPSHARQSSPFMLFHLWFPLFILFVSNGLEHFFLSFFSDGHPPGEQQQQ
ncbi:hypothetical protein IWX90DRAFT_311055 [Phyllosticta citrichinensis]|uniref:Uncharacterized protein n=1 Tax=Phyllosticta citrichinensis TaxID=1130410 RepID=A0ABR1XLU8_9PEZI